MVWQNIRSIDIDGNWPEHEFDIEANGWAGGCSFPNNTNFNDHWKFYLDTIRWIKDNIENHRSNVLWTKIGDCIYFKFRKERDYALFLLRWS